MIRFFGLVLALLLAACAGEVPPTTTARLALNHAANVMNLRIKPALKAICKDAPPAPPPPSQCEDLVDGYTELAVDHKQLQDGLDVIEKATP
jgi:hypothetical protein